MSARAGETQGQCHLCRRLFPVEEMGVDADGDFWCRDWPECNRLAKQRLANPDSVWRKRREVARLEWKHMPPPSVEEMFGLVVDTVALFGLRDIESCGTALADPAGTPNVPSLPVQLRLL